MGAHDQLIAKARRLTYYEPLFGFLADALESAAADLEWLEREKAELAAVIEQARERAAELTVGRHLVVAQAARPLLRILATSPTEALKAVKAAAWDEGYDAFAEQGIIQIPDNPYRTEPPA